MKIRRAANKDKKQLIKTLIDFDNHARSYLPADHYEFRRFTNLEKAKTDELEDYFSSGALIFVAEEGKKIVGFIVGSIKDRKNRVNDKEGYIEKWYIVHSFQGKKFGKELFSTLEQEFRKQGCTHLALETHVDNHKAISIYENMGFKKRMFNFFKILN